MSFILDALRKSEHQRQRHSGPGIAELPAARSVREAPWMPVAIIALVVLNLGVLAFFLLRDDRAAVTAPAAPPPATEARVAAPQPAPIDPPADAATGTVPLEQLMPATAPQAAPGAPDPTLLPAAPARVFAPAPVQASNEGLPSIHSLSPQVTAGLPALSIDLHVYVDDPARRAVFINGRRYQEGGALPEGPVVESITRDGAVLSHRGRRFLLPRQ